MQAFQPLSVEAFSLIADRVAPSSVIAIGDGTTQGGHLRWQPKVVPLRHHLWGGDHLWWKPLVRSNFLRAYLLYDMIGRQTSKLGSSGVSQQVLFMYIKLCRISIRPIFHKLYTTNCMYLCEIDFAPSQSIIYNLNIAYEYFG